MTLNGYWPLNEESGEALDHSGSENHGTLNGGVTQGVTGLLGDTSYSFSGDGGEVDSESALISGQSSLTASAWINAESITSSSNSEHYESNNQIVSNIEGWDNDTWAMALDSSNEVFFYIDEGGNEINFRSSSGPVTTNEWIHITCVYQASRFMKIYVNGTKVAENSVSTGTLGNTTNSLKISLDGSNSFNGKISEVRIYDRPLTKSEIQYLYSVGERGLQVTSKKSS